MGFKVNYSNFNMLYLVGFMGCGKTTIGKMLADRLDREFVDTDAHIEQVVGKTCSEIFKELGEPKFRELERECLESLQSRSGCVISVGGGLACNEGNQKLINQGTVIYLRGDSKTLANRILLSKINRPLVYGLSYQELVIFIYKLVLERDIYYTKADIIVDIAGLNAEELVEVIYTYLSCNFKF